MDLQTDFTAMFAEGDDIIVDGVTLKGFVVHPGVFEEPFYGDVPTAGNTLSVIVQQGDLKSIGQWPLAEPQVEIDALVYRPIRSHLSAGHVQIFLQEA